MPPPPSATARPGDAHGGSHGHAHHAHRDVVTLASRGPRLACAPPPARAARGAPPASPGRPRSTPACKGPHSSYTAHMPARTRDHHAREHSAARIGGTHPSMFPPSGTSTDSSDPRGRWNARLLPACATRQRRAMSRAEEARSSRERPTCTRRSDSRRSSPRRPRAGSTEVNADGVVALGAAARYLVSAAMGGLQASFHSGLPGPR